MKIGTKSLLFGVHQFIWHPITVLLAWIELYGLPHWQELVCIVIHDWGYWGSPNMDGKEGEEHPVFGANLAHKLLDRKGHNNYGEQVYGVRYFHLCLYHSRHYAKRHNALPSMLCWADKLSIKYDPWWLYLPRAIMTGELKEYRELHGLMGDIPVTATNGEWYDWAAKRAIKMGLQQSSGDITFHPAPEERP